MNNRILSSCLCVLGLWLAAADAALSERLVPASVQASSFEKPEFRPENVADGDAGTRWSSKVSDPQWIMEDLGGPRTIGKVVLDWETACAEVYQVQASEDNRTWHVLFAEPKGEPGRKEISFKPTTARYVRVYGIKRKANWGYSLIAFDVFAGAGATVPLSTFTEASQYRFDRVSLQPAAYFSAAAGVAPKGYYPIWVGNQQGYWTVAGTDEGPKESLLCEDGTVELYPRGWSLMPYLYVGGKLVTAQDAKLTQSLDEEYMPIPSVAWEHGGLTFKQRLFVAGGPDANVAYVEYRIENRGAAPAAGRFFLTLRPFQVTPSWQGEGGKVDIFSLKLQNNGEPNEVLVNEKDVLRCLKTPDRAGAVSYQEGEVIDFIARGELPPHQTVFDPWGGASGALQYDFDLPPGTGTNYFFAAPLGKNADIAQVTPDSVLAELARTRDFWKKKLNKVTINVPYPYLVNVLRANLAYILVNKDGPVIQPGSRHYERTWIRDGCLIGIALLRFGYVEEVRDYIDWIADRQLFDGDVPCMINADGSMWEWGKTLPEYDGQGAFVTLVSEYYKYSGDKELLERRFPNVVKALQFAEYLRKQRLTDEYKNATDEKARYYGILPLSVSHEGYAQPGKHSYWDDFFALKGWREGVVLAKTLGRDDLIPWMEKEETDLRRCLLNSIERTQADKAIPFIPGCADLGDFDAASTAIALWPTEEYRALPQDELLLTLDKYHREVLAPRIAGKSDPTSGYVPYEMRLGTAFLILGEKQKALDVSRHFLGVTAPRAWNQWAEVVYGAYRTPGYIGDMPHSWAGADYLNLVRTKFILEDADRLVLGLGIEEAWLEREQGISIADFPTPFGRLGYEMRKKDNVVTVRLSGDAAPAGGFVFKSPLAAPCREVRVNGAAAGAASEARFSELPAEVVFVY